MNLLENSLVKEYISSLKGKSSCHYLHLKCQCIKENMPLYVHDNNARPFSNNLLKLAIKRSKLNPRSVVMYISKNCYFSGDSMMFLVHKMFTSEDIIITQQFQNILEEHFVMHPPCASYMNGEYEYLLLTPFEDFKNMSLWDYLIELFDHIISGSYLYGQNKVIDFAFESWFSFCVSVLQINFEMSKKKGFTPLIMKCLRFNPERRTRMSEITKLLDKLFNTGYDFEVPIINLAKLVNQMMAKTQE